MRILDHTQLDIHTYIRIPLTPRPDITDLELYYCKEALVYYF